MTAKRSPSVINRNRHSTRMKGYDYSLEGVYFITISTYQHCILFGEIVNGVVVLNQFGSIASQQWILLMNRFKDCDFTNFVIMPNHVHGIVHTCRGAGEGFTQEPNQNPPLRPYIGVKITSGSLAAIVRAYKASVAFRINAIRGYTKPPIWQRNYYDHIIRNDSEFHKIRDYIETNPLNWSTHELYSTTQN